MDVARPGRELTEDVGLAALVGIIAELELVRSAAPYDRLATPAAAAAIAAALALRRRAPTFAVITVLLVNLAHRLAVGQPAPGLADPPNSFALASAWLIAVYSAAAFAKPTRALAALAAAATTTLAFTATCSCSPQTNDYLAALLLSVAVPWLGGFARARHAASVDARRAVDEQRREHARAQTDALAVERGRIARELHDIVAHGLSVIVVQAPAERRQLPPAAVETRSVLAAIEDAGRSALTELRRLLGVLRTPGDAPLGPQPRIEDLEHIVAAVRQAGVETRIHTEGVECQLPPGIETSVYRVAQEALTNVVRHAGASHADLTLRYATGYVDVEVVDDGTNPPAGEPSGFGLIGARERVTSLGGSFLADRRDGGGFRVLARFPLLDVT